MFPLHVFHSPQFGFFDPLGFSKGVSDKDAKRWREVSIVFDFLSY